MPSAPNTSAARTLYALTQRFRSALRAAGLAAGLAVLPAAPVGAQAMAQNFDGLVCDSGGTAIPNGTGGLDWTNFFCLVGSAYPYNPSGYQPGTTSAPNAALNGFENPAALRRTGGGLFSLTSGQFTAAWNDGLTITIVGTRAGATVATVRVLPSPTAPMLVDLRALSNVDNVTFTPTGGTRHPGYNGEGRVFALDDLNYVLGALHPITVTAPTHGTLRCSPNPVPHGTNATCTAAPDAGYTLASFTGCTRDGTADTCTLTNVTAPATVSASFAAAPVAVPALTEWALMLLGLGAAGLGARRLRRAS